MKCRSNPGFALLEALVALVIVSGVGTALFAMINTGLQSLSKAEAHIATTAIQPQVLAWVRQISLENLPEQLDATQAFSTRLGTIQARADFERYQGPTFTVTGSGAMGIHQVALYDVEVSLTLNERPMESLFTRVVASNQVFDEPTL